MLHTTTGRSLRFRAAAAALAASTMALVAHGHVDDPKLRDRQPFYDGPGWTASQDSAPGLDFPAAGIELMAWITIPDFNAAGPVTHNGGNDCWGYVSPSGREYALMGLSNGTAFVEITDPANPQIIEIVPAVGSLWRDVKTYADRAYIVTEGGGGIQVVDMRQIDQGIVTEVGSFASGATHNVAIDTTSGFLYRCGGGSNGLRIYDLSNPDQPAFVGDWNDRYVHDAQIVTTDEVPPRQLAYCCGGFNGGFVDTGLYIVDVTDKSNPQLLSYRQHENPAYSHQGWLSDDGTIFYLNDEINEQDYGIPSTTQVFDVSDASNPVELGSFTNGRTASTHNLYTVGDLMFASNYRSGLRVFDLSQPGAGVEIAFFDTYPESEATGYNGLWSNYPYFPSGTIIGSDLEKGLFIWRGAFNQLAIDFPEGRPELIDPSGDSVAVTIENLDGELDPTTAMLVYDDGGGPVSVPMTALGGQDFEAVFPSIECGTTTFWYVEATTVDGNTVRAPADAPVGRYETLAALDLFVTFEEDFETDSGWTVSNSGGLTDGAWERGTPIGGGDRGDPADDGDGSGQCYVTDNADGNSDVDGGSTTLTSPVLDASGEATAIAYFRWYSNTFGSDPMNDVFVVEVSDDAGESWTELETVGPDGPEVDGGWFRRQFTLSEIPGFEANDQFRIRFTASDLADGSVVEAGVDGVEIVELECTSDCAADVVGGDGVVDTTDLLGLLAAWGTDGAGAPIAEPVDVVDTADLLGLLASWGPCP